MAKPFYTNAEMLNTYLKTGLVPPVNAKVVSALTRTGPSINFSSQKALRVMDEQNAINKFNWYNLPSGLTGQMIERMLYYRGSICFFYIETAGDFYMLPYALDGGIDVYGRYRRIRPLPWANGKIDPDTDKIKSWLDEYKKEVLWNPESIIDPSNEIDWVNKGCIILNDYTPQNSNFIIPRVELQEPIINVMADIIPMCRTSLIANCGVKGVKVSSDDEAINVTTASNTMYKNALEGKPMIPIVGKLEFQDLTNGAPLTSEDYLLALQGLDNYRLSLHGLGSGGLFQKSSHMLQEEVNANQGNIGLVYQDQLTIRQRFCDWVNAVWGLGIWVEPSENVTGLDNNMDGVIGDEQDQTGAPGEQPKDIGGTDNEQ